MNKTCCLCKKDFRLPCVVPETVESYGLSMEGRHTVKGMPLNYHWYVKPVSGFICPACVYEQILKIIQMHAKDVDGLLAGRNYGIEMEE